VRVTVQQIIIVIMAGTDDSKRDALNPALRAAAVEDRKSDEPRDIVEAERAQSMELEKSGAQNFAKVDKELANYISEGHIEISEEENTRLRRLVDKRILLVMITTYFLQAIDKGTMSFASIMGIVEDTKLVGQDVSADDATALITSTANTIPTHSTNGSQPVSTSPSWLSSIRRTTSSLVSPSPSISVSPSWPGAPSWPAPQPARPSPASSPCAPS
jgi:hypothetical protein